ncbi:sugar phosphate isomerase/epimerase family protein [Homoserinimonas sp. A447]
MLPLPPLGIAPLCAIGATPAEYVAAAASAGFDFVGIRVSPVTEVDTVYTPDGDEFRELERLIADSGLFVLDTEVFRMTEHATAELWMPLLEMSARLGARLFNVVGADPDLSRLADSVGSLTRDAASFGITPVLEPLSYLPLNSYTAAVDIALAVGCAVELDGLHAIRTGLDPRLVAEHPDLFPVFQVCDAPAVLVEWGEERPPGARPGDSDMIIESRLNRLLPGRGDSPLGELMAALPRATPLAMEVPNLELQARHSVDEYIELLHREAVEFVTRFSTSA